MTDKLDAERFYYVKKKNGDVCIRQSHLFSTLKTEKAVPFVDFDDDDIEKILAPVPTYQDLQRLKAQLAEHKEYCCCAKNEVLVLENANLKELLEGCKDIIEWYKADCGYKDLPTESVLTKINEVLR